MRVALLSAAVQSIAPADTAKTAAKNLRLDMNSFPFRMTPPRYECAGSSPFNSPHRSSKVTPLGANDVGYLRKIKIDFGFTVAGDRSIVETARRVVELLELMGHEVLTRHLVSDNA